MTQNTPKSLLFVCGQPIIKYTINSLPNEVDEIIIVVDYLGEKIREYLYREFPDKNIRFVEQDKSLSGTASALWSVKPFINEEKFLVLNGDDIYDKNEIEAFLDYRLGIGVHFGKPRNLKFLAIDFNSKGYLSGFHRPINLKHDIWIATGAYILDKRIFNSEPVKLPDGELGLPQTILKTAMANKIKYILMKNWIQINEPEDIEIAEEKLKL